MDILLLIFKVIMFIIAGLLMLKLLGFLLELYVKGLVGLLLLPSKVWAWAEARDLRFQEEELIVAEHNRDKGE